MAKLLQIGLNEMREKKKKNNWIENKDNNDCWI